jgi:ribosomal protein S18 acetylase RimI-like enzyme/8-oxo-dGTP pyrophosphatase MutT (NUDIX family)
VAYSTRRMIRPANQSDADAIWDIFQAVVAGRDTYAFLPDTPRDEAVGYWLGDDMIACVAELDGRVVGMYKLIDNRRGLGAHVANASFMVHPAASGHGVGHALGEHCLREARRQGYEAMQFNFVVSTNTRAVALWQSLGFRIVGTAPRAFRHGTLGLVDALVMHRDLDDIVLTFGDPPAEGAAIDRPSAYGVVTNARREIAIVQAKEGIMLPGGGIDAGESAADAVQREVAEECGLEVAVTGDLGEAVQFVTSLKKGGTFEKRSRFSSAGVRSTLAGVTAEHTTQWLNVRDAIETVTYESHVWAIRRWLRLNM